MSNTTAPLVAENATDILQQQNNNSYYATTTIIISKWLTISKGLALQFQQKLSKVLLWLVALLKSAGLSLYTFCGKLYHRIQTDIQYWWEILQQRAQSLFAKILCYPCIEWLQEQTGIPSKWITIVVVLGLLLLMSLLAVMMLRKGNRRHYRRHRRQRSRGRSRDRSLSLDRTRNRHRKNTHNNNDPPLIVRERGMSLDLSASQLSTRSRSRSRGYSFDPRQRKRSNSLDLLTAEELFQDLNNPVQHGVLTTTSTNNNNNSNHNPTSTTTTQNRHRRRHNNIQPTITYYGPTEKKLLYNTITPPPSWQEASRSLLPQDGRMKLQRQLVLDLSLDQCTVTIQEPPSSSSTSSSHHHHYNISPRHRLVLPVTQCSVHVKSPALGGVLELYVKQSPKEDWMEHTFVDSAHYAAQFQIDLLALQIFGPQLYRMYSALELIHQGSMACEGKEYVCHHEQFDEQVSQGVGIAWDDVMRALGSNIPSVRVALERLWWQHYKAVTLRLRARNRNRAKNDNSNTRKQQQALETDGNNNNGSGNNNNTKNSTTATTTTEDNDDEGGNKHQNDYLHLTMEYIRKRLMLGPIDFFRLFVPSLPDTALPRNDSSQKRMEQLLQWRKRTARAALLVQTYVKARIIVNHGWVLNKTLPTHYLTRRLAYDDNIDNSQRDASAKNEYYEATVSRDVLTFVRPNEPDAFQQPQHWWEWRPNQHRSVISRYQAFALVGHHIFKIPDDPDFPLRPQHDPVKIIPSLLELIESNPESEFFVHAMFPEASKVGFVSLYIRTLPPGIDPAFDTNMSRYKNGTKAVRDQKLWMNLQLFSSENKPISEMMTASMMSFLMNSATQGFDTTTPNSNIGPSDRSPFPIIPLAGFSETRHFGGSMQTDRRHSPSNYVSVTSHIDAKRAAFNIISRLVLSSMERGVLAKNVFDMTMVLTAQEQDELPERALCTMRIVHCNPNDVALPSIFIWGSHNRRRGARRRRRHDDDETSSVQESLFRSVVGNLATFGDRLAHLNINRQDNMVNDEEAGNMHLTPEDAKQCLARNTTCTTSSDDPIEQSVNLLVQILDDVKIPVRRDQLEYYAFASSIPISLLEVYSSTTSNALLHDNNNNQDLLNMSLLLLVKREDIKRHLIASGCNIKKAAVRIVESTAWYGQTFPIDTRMCRIELQSGQFFQQGRDLCGRPVFYFRNMGRGPWRKDCDASVAAVLHRLDGALRELSRRDPCVQMTLIVIVGKPFRPKDRKKLEGGGDNASTAGGGGGVGGDDDAMSLDADNMISQSFQDNSMFENTLLSDVSLIANPRINAEEPWQLHTNKKLVKQLIELLSAHYPERLYQALVLVNDNQILSLKRLLGPFTLSSFVESTRTRSKVKFLSKFSELERYVSKSELCSIAGGLQPLPPSSLELSS